MYELVINFLINYFVKKRKKKKKGIKIFMDLIVLYFVLNKYFN